VRASPPNSSPGVRLLAFPVLLVCLSLARVLGAFLAEPGWTQVRAVSRGLRTSDREVWSIVVRAHGFVVLDEVSLVEVPAEVRTFGAVTVYGLRPLARTWFTVAVPRSRGRMQLTVEATVGGRRVRRTVYLVPDS